MLHYLLKGKQPIIVALARNLKQQIEPAFKIPMEEGRLLFVTPFDKDIKRVTTQTAMVRNKMMIELADHITVGFANKGGQLESILKTTEKRIEFIEPNSGN